MPLPVLTLAPGAFIGIAKQQDARDASSNVRGNSVLASRS